MKNKVSFSICGVEHHVITDESVEYTKMLAEKIDEKMASYLDGNPFVNRTRASVLTMLDFADMLQKAQDENAALRDQVNGYLEDATKAKSERDYYKRELERIKTEAKFKNDQINLFAKANGDNNE